METGREGMMKQTARQSDDVQELVTRITRALVEDPDKVIVEKTEDRDSTWLRVRVAPSDVGRIEGQQGRATRAVRAILAAVSRKQHHRYLFVVDERNQGADESFL
jgi:predicted RNA-binding protein YlqC (UPF0109 family)